MNSAIRVFNDAIIATGAGGMVSEKVRGLILYQSMICIMVMVLCQNCVSWCFTSKGGVMCIVVVEVNPGCNAVSNCSKNVARGVRACLGPGCYHGCRLPSSPGRAAGVRGHREA